MKTMKNNIFNKSKICLIAVVFVLLCVPSTIAQDTIIGREITYIYPDNWDGNQYVGWSSPWWGYHAQYYFTDTQLSIIGVAFSSKPRWDNPGDCVIPLGLWKHQSSGMTLLAEKNIDPSFVSRYMAVGEQFMPYESSSICPIQEARFDSAITVQDSFYVSYYIDGSNRMNTFILLKSLSTSNQDGFRIASGSRGSNGNINWGFVVGDVANGVFINHLPYMFPIIDTTGMIFPCDTMTCANTSGFHLTAQSGDHATFAWVGAPEHTEWEVSYGPVGTEPGGGRVLHPTTTNVVVSNMRPETHYVAYVRGFCPECKVWSEWSEGVEFWMGMNGGTEGVPIVEHLTYISPNPAHGEVQVFSSFGIRKVSIYNVQGIQVSTRQVPGYSALIDVSALPAGLYFVNVHTHAGTVTKKLVVE